MGNYTKLNFKAKLKSDTPNEVIHLLNRVTNERDLGIKDGAFETEDVFNPELDHPFFRCESWYMLLMQDGTFCKEGGDWVLVIDTDFKNYDSEIENFLEWVKPFIIGRKKKQYVGQYKRQDDDLPTNIYVNR